MQDVQRINELRNRFDRRYNAMEQERSSFIPHWQEIADYLNPRSFQINSIQYNKGAKANQNILDPTATKSLETLKSGLMAGLTSPSRPWFRIVPVDPDLAKRPGVKVWAYAVETRMREMFSRSNLYMVLPIVYNNLASFGTACMSAMEDPRNALRFYSYQTGTFCIAVNDKMRCDTIYRKFSMTVQQLVQRFGRENCSDTVLSQYDSDQLQNYVEVIHAIEPNDDRDPKMNDAKNNPFRSVYYETGGDGKKFLEESGYSEFPIMAPRWDIYNSQDAYGYAPGMTALGSIKGLQLLHRRKYEAIDKYVRPAMLADATLRSQMISTVPGSVTYIDGLIHQAKPGFTRLEQELPDLSHVLNDIGDVRMLIRRCFFEDLMQMLAQSDNPEMTAREIEERHAEKVLVLGPVMERMNDELFDPLIERCYSIMDRQGLLPPPPEELQGQGLKIEYTSIMAQAMKMMGIANIEKSAQFVGMMAQMNPSAMDKWNIDEAIDTYTDAMGINPRIIRTADQTAQIRDQRQKMQQMQQMSAMAEPVERAAKAGKAVGDTDPDNVRKIVGMITGQG